MRKELSGKGGGRQGSEVVYQPVIPKDNRGVYLMELLSGPSLYIPEETPGHPQETVALWNRGPNNAVGLWVVFDILYT